jgi:nicotinamide N-methyltransferase
MTVAEVEGKTPTRSTFPDGTHSPRGLSEMENMPSPDHSDSQQLETLAIPGPAAAAASGATDESDTDFQSAYSTSPRDSYGESKHLEQDLPTTIHSPKTHYTDTHALVKSQGDSDFEDTTSTSITTG